MGGSVTKTDSRPGTNCTLPWRRLNKPSSSRDSRCYRCSGWVTHCGSLAFVRTACLYHISGRRYAAWFVQDEHSQQQPRTRKTRRQCVPTRARSRSGCLAFMRPLTAKPQQACSCQSCAPPSLLSEGSEKHSASARSLPHRIRGSSCGARQAPGESRH